MLANCPRTGAKTCESMLTQNYSFQFLGKLCFVIPSAKKTKRQQIILGYMADLNNICCPNEWKCVDHSKGTSIPF